MATYLELSNYSSTPEYQTLVNKIKVAVAIKAKAITDLETPTANQINFAKRAFEAPSEVSSSIVNYVLAANAAVSITAINAASDSAIQTNVNLAVDDLLAL